MLSSTRKGLAAFCGAFAAETVNLDTEFEIFSSTALPPQKPKHKYCGFPELDQLLRVARRSSWKELWRTAQSLPGLLPGHTICARSAQIVYPGSCPGKLCAFRHNSYQDDRLATRKSWSNSGKPQYFHAASRSLQKRCMIHS